MRAAWLLPALVLAACDREPTFEDRYDNAQATIRATAADIDNDMAALEAREAREAAANGSAAEPGNAADR